MGAARVSKSAREIGGADMSESNLSKQIAVELSKAGRGKIVSWRNNVGVGVAISARGGMFGKISAAVIALACKMGAKASIVKFGLCVGSSDRIGITTVLITPDMVGRDVGVFTAWEVKATAKDHPTPDQINFIQAVRAAGGYAGVVRSVDEAVAVCWPLKNI